MTFKDLASQIACCEGKKSQASIGDIREILSLLIDMQVEYQENACDREGPVDLLLKMAQKKVK